MEPMPRFGAHAYLWIDQWTVELGNQAINGAARAGFDFIELPLYNLDEFDPEAHKSVLADAGLGASAAVVLPEHAHMPENPAGAKQFLVKAMDKVEAVGGFCLGGCTAYALGKFTGRPPTQGERQVVIDTLGDLAIEAERRGLLLVVEILNRYETYLYNTLADARESILAVGSDNVKIQADTYHMNIEERGFYQPLVDCADSLGYLHISESHRGFPGTGTINWDEVFRGLADASYQGPLTYESFVNVSPDLMAATKIWRAPQTDSDTMAIKALAFMTDYARRYNL
jgi:D-psicose/D-tagatose/L-ribulose 3-epimerase